jgi:hypothetical protein
MRAPAAAPSSQVPLPFPPRPDGPRTWQHLRARRQHNNFNRQEARVFQPRCPPLQNARLRARVGDVPRARGVGLVVPGPGGGLHVQQTDGARGLRRSVRRESHTNRRHRLEGRKGLHKDGAHGRRREPCAHLTGARGRQQDGCSGPVTARPWSRHVASAPDYAGPARMHGCVACSPAAWGSFGCLLEESSFACLLEGS